MKFDDEELQTLFNDGMLFVPKTQSLRDKIKEVAATVPKMRFDPTQVTDELKAMREGIDSVPFPTINDDWYAVAKQPVKEVLNIPGPEGEWTLRITIPEGEIKGGLLDLHGGGYVIGSAKTDDLMNAYFAHRCGVVVGSVDYRLAPDHHYPTPFDDCEAGALRFIEYMREHFANKPLLGIGMSAGGSLILSTALRLKLNHQIDLQGVIAQYGIADVSNTVPSRTAIDCQPVAHDATSCESYSQALVPDEPLRSNPDLSPVYRSNEELMGMPPALFTVGGIDPLRDDMLLMYMRWRMAGNEAYLLGFNGHGHTIGGFDCPEQDFHYEAVVEFIHRQLS